MKTPSRVSLTPCLTLAGKKSPDLGEYDPLTQADSDESEDDLVLNLQQKNGGVKNGKSALGEAPEPDSDVEAAGTAKPHHSEVTTEGYPAEPLGSLEQKATSPLVAYVRTSVFLLALGLSMLLVLLCAFLIPCPPRDLHSTWSRHLGSQAGEVQGCRPLFHLSQEQVGPFGILLNVCVRLGAERSGVEVRTENETTRWMSVPLGAWQSLFGVVVFIGLHEGTVLLAPRLCGCRRAVDRGVRPKASLTTPGTCSFKQPDLIQT